MTHALPGLDVNLGNLLVYANFPDYRLLLEQSSRDAVMDGTDKPNRPFFQLARRQRLLYKGGQPVYSFLKLRRMRPVAISVPCPCLRSSSQALDPQLYPKA